MRSADDKEARWREAYPRTVIPIILHIRFVVFWLLIGWLCYTFWTFVLSFT